MSAPNIVALTDSNFADEVLKSPLPIMVDFWAEWCAPCKMVAPILEELATEYEGKARVGKVNVEECPALGTQYNVTALPTFLFFKGGQVVDQFMGARSKRDFKTRLDRVTS